MATGFHTAVLATAFAATLAVGLASASIVLQSDVAPKADRLPVASNAGTYATVETRQDGVSTLNRIRVDFN